MPMKRFIEVGEVVSFVMNTGQATTGVVIERIAERQQPVILLIERANGWRCFRFEDEVTTDVAPAFATAVSRPKLLQKVKLSHHSTANNGDKFRATSRPAHTLSRLPALREIRQCDGFDPVPELRVV